MVNGSRLGRGNWASHEVLAHVADFSEASVSALEQTPQSVNRTQCACYPGNNVDGLAWVGVESGEDIRGRSMKSAKARSWVLAWTMAASWPAPAVTAQEASATPPSESAAPVAEDNSLFPLRDRIKVRGGGQLSGQVVDEAYADPASGKTMIALRSPSGGQIMLEKSRVGSIEFKTGLEQSAYEGDFAAMADTADAHRAMAESLRKKPGGKSRFAAQIEFHLRRLIELDPNDDDARRHLGQIRVENNVWVDEELYFISHGYVRDGSKWKSRLEVQLQSARDQAEARVEAARSAYLRLRNRLPQLDRGTAAAELQALMIPELVARLHEDAMETDDDLNLKRLLMEGIATQETYVAANSLLYFRIFDSDPNIRDFAMTLIRQGNRNIDGLALNACQLLQLNSREVVNRVGGFLGELGSPIAIPALIRAVVTEHEEANPGGGDPGRMNFNIQNGNVQGFGVNNDPKVVKVRRANPGVIDALRRLTQVDHGNDQKRWTQWYIENYTLANHDLSRDQ